VKRRKNNGKINPDEATKLWIYAGGRCEYPGCNEYLLEDKLTGRIYNFGEMAHNVGIKNTKGSPRGLNTLPIITRSKAENHLLLCAKHHKLIDTGKFLDFYTVKELQSYKENHEIRINYLTGLNDSRKSVVLRMMNRIHKDPVSVTNEEIVEALWKCANRYPEYLLKVQNNLEIDLSDLPDNRDQAYWKTAMNRIDEVIEHQLKPQVRKVINHISIFALTPIPLMVYLGAKLGDKLRMDVYQKQFNADEDWVWCKESRKISFTYNKIQDKQNNIKVAVLISISGKISMDSLPQEVRNNYTLYEISPKDALPNRELVQNKQTLLNFKNIYQQLLRHIESTHSNSKELLLFPAIPISISIFCGRGLLKAVSPKLVIYEIIKRKFKKAIIIKI
jgi:hypothetical protein